MKMISTLFLLLLMAAGGFQALEAYANLPPKTSALELAEMSVYDRHPAVAEPPEQEQVEAKVAEVVAPAWAKSVDFDCEKSNQCKVLPQFAGEIDYAKVVRPQAPEMHRQQPTVRVQTRRVAAVQQWTDHKVDCDNLGCRDRFVMNNGKTVTVPQYKLRNFYPKAGIVRDAAAQLASKAVGFAAGPAASTLMCALLNTDFDERSSINNAGLTTFRCSPFGFIDAQKYARSDAERAFLIGTGVVGLAGLGGLPLPDAVYNANSLAGTFGQLVPWKKLSQK